MLLRVVTQSGEIVERMRDELLVARILSLQCGGEELYKILRLGRGLWPGLRRSGQEKFLELFLMMSQGRLIGPNLVEAPPNFGRFLRRHAAALVEGDRVVRQGLVPFFWLPFRRGARLQRLRLFSAPPGAPESREGHSPSRA